MEAMATPTPHVERGGDRSRGERKEMVGTCWDSPVVPESLPEPLKICTNSSVELSAICHQNRPQKYWPEAKLRQAPARQRAARTPVLAEPEDEQTPLEREVITLKMQISGWTWHGDLLVVPSAHSCAV